MAPVEEDQDPPSSGPQQFATTGWSQVLAAGERASPQSLVALARLHEASAKPAKQTVSILCKAA